MTIDLREIPVIMIGGVESQHRYAHDPGYRDLILPHTDNVPPQPGGNTLGASTAHSVAMTEVRRYPGQAVLLMEDDAVMSSTFSPDLRDIPDDADIVWLGCSVGWYKGLPSPGVEYDPGSQYQRLTGVCQASHAILLLTDAGKRVWEHCARRAVQGECKGYIDLACSVIGHSMCKQYVVTNPLFVQPDHQATFLPVIKPTPSLDLREIPVIMVGGIGVSHEFQHRYAYDPARRGSLFPHTDNVLPQPGGNTVGGATAHLMAAAKALEHPGAVLLLEDDAVMVDGFDPALWDVPGDADIVWLGRSVGFYGPIPSPVFERNPVSQYQRLTGECQACHAVLLLTTAGKIVWEYCSRITAQGAHWGAVDLTGSAVGHSMCTQYVVTDPLFVQPDHPATFLPLRGLC